MYGKFPKSKKFWPIFLFMFLVFLPVPTLASPPDIALVQPSQGQVFNSSNNITFTCNATDEGQVLNLSLYHNMNGSFSLNQTQNYGELPFDSNTTFLCRFNGNLVCQGGGSGNSLAAESLSFQPGKFSQGVYINETGLLRYQTSGNFDRSRGTIEFWIRPGSDMSSYSWYIFDIADNNAADQNEMAMYVNAGTLYLEIYDSSNPSVSHVASKDISSWLIGNWYHVAALWNISGDAGNGNPLDIYVNGLNDGVSYTGDPTISYTLTSSSFSLGSTKYNDTQVNSTIDDFRISNVVRNASEINQSYWNGLGNYSSVSKSWTFYSVPDGSYLWNCLAYDNDSEANSSSNRSFYMDISTPPAVNAVFLSPNSSDDIDPGVTINVTANISDPSGVSTVIFQWKEAEEENWNNITMAYNASSGLYENASFQTSIMEGDYYYRTWSNDSKGSYGYSPTQNVTSEWDYTWTRSPASFGTVLGFIKSIDNLDMLTINNTGDRTLNFTLSDNWLLYYNGSDNMNFYIANHTAITLNITAKFADEPSENDILIIINASHYLHIPSPVSLATNATINSYSGGPYLVVSIMEYTSMVYQGQTFNLSARVKNIGNETAEGVWFNWSLPPGWSNTSGDVAYFAGNLTPGSSAWNNLTVTVNPSSASPGTFIIYANSSCSQNVTGCDSKIDSETVGVECSDSDGVCGYGCSYVNDDNCGIPAGGAGTTETVFVGRGGAEEIQYIIRMEAPSSFDIQRGDKKTVRVKITNEGKRTNLTGIYLSITGYPLTHIGINPPFIDRLEYNQTAWFELEFFAPNYTKYGMHNLTLTASGKGSTSGTKNLTSVERTERMSIVVHSVYENETNAMLEDAEKAVQEMAGAGLNVDKAKSLLEEAKSQISQWDYDTSLETSKSILELKEKSFRITSMIKQIDDSIREAETYGIQTPESRKMRELSASALEREDYAKAEERANNALVAYVIESRGIETIRFVLSNWQIIAAVSASFAAAVYFAYRRLLKRIIRRRIESLSQEEKAVKKLMEKAQEERYRERTISDVDYHRLMAEHESGLAKMKKKKYRLMRRMLGLEKPSTALANFRRQEESLTREIQELQKRYYERGSVTKSSYQKTIDELREELAERTHTIGMILQRINKRKGQAGLLVLGILLFSIVFAGFALGQADERQAAVDAMAKAELRIREMQQLGFPANRANDTLNEARLLFSKGFYKGAESLANEVEAIKSRAISVDKKIDETEGRIYQVSLRADVSHAKPLFDEAISSFRGEDYDRAEELLSRVDTTLEEIEAEASLKRMAEGQGWEGILRIVRENIVLLAALAVAAAAGVFLGARYRKRKGILKKISKLRKESESVSSMIKELQVKYFEKGQIGKNEYEMLTGRYSKKLAGIKRRTAVLEGRLKPQKQKAN